MRQGRRQHNGVDRQRRILGVLVQLDDGDITPRERTGPVGGQRFEGLGPPPLELSPDGARSKGERSRVLPVDRDDQGLAAMVFQQVAVQ